MSKTSRRERRSIARERKAAQRRRADYRAGLRRKLRVGGLAVFLTAVGGGLAFDGTSYFASPAGGTLDVAAELSAQEFEAVPRQSEEELWARWEQIDELQRQMHREIATELRVSPAIPPLLVAGSSAAEIVPKEVLQEIVPVEKQLELREAADPVLKRARERSDERLENARSATF